MKELGNPSLPTSLTCGSTLAEKNKNKILEGELFALRQIVVELEAKLLEVFLCSFLPLIRFQKNLSSRHHVEKVELEFQISNRGSESGRLYEDMDDPEEEMVQRKDRWSSTDLVLPIGEVESLRLESLQLRSLLVGEIETLENVVLAKQEEAKSAQATASDYVLRFGSSSSLFLLFNAWDRSVAARARSPSPKTYYEADSRATRTDRTRRST
jgi:hypothetical protein